MQTQTPSDKETIMASKAKAPTNAEQDTEDSYQAQADADTMQRHQEITQDPARHQKAADHLAKTAATAKDAHKTARKQLEKKTKGRLKKTFGGNKDGGAGTFESEKSKEAGPMEAVVRQDD